MMRKVIEVKPEQVTPPAEAVLKGQGVPSDGNANERTVSLVREALSRLQVLSQPAGLVMEVSKEQFRPVFDGRGDNAAESPLEGIFQSAHSCALFAVTLGETVCAEICRLFDTTEYALGAMLDAAASETTELLAGKAQECYYDYLARSDRFGDSDGIMQFSPGYCGWHISAQAQLFETLVPDEIGITLNESFLMRPIKSISGVIIAGEKKIFQFDDSFEFCTECRTRSCIERQKALRKQ
jgi:hypothetical protein